MIEQCQEEFDAFYRVWFPEPMKTQQQHTDHTPPTLDDRELTERVMEAKNGHRFTRLWRGDTSDYGNDDSNADIALCGYLAFWTGPDPVRIDRLFRQSGLMRDKWDSRRPGGTYGSITIERALAGRTEFYTGATTDTFADKARHDGADDSADGAHDSGSHAPGAEAQWDEPVPLRSYFLPFFPLHSLPSWLAEYVGDLAEALQVPVCMVGMFALSVVSAAVAGKVKVLVKEGYLEPVNIWTLTIAAPGERKTAVYLAATAPLSAYESEEAARLAPQIAEEQSRRKILEATLQQAEGAAAKANAAECANLVEKAAEAARALASFRVSTAPRLMTEDCTPERLGSLMCENDGRIAILTDEAGLFDMMGGKYSGNTPNLDNYLKGHAGSNLRIDRGSRPSEYIPRPALTIGAMAQPEAVRALNGHAMFRGRGLLARFAYSMPVSLLGTRKTDTAAVPPLVLATYEAKIRALLRLECGTDTAGNLEPALVRLTPDAYKCWKTFSSWVEPQLAVGGALGTLTDWAGKLPGAVARYAAVLHMATHADDRRVPWRTPISRATMVAAIGIGEYLIPHARATFAQMGADAANEHARYILAWITRAPRESFTRTEILRDVRGTVTSAEDLNAALALLIEHGYIREKPKRKPDVAGRPPTTYLVNPQCYEINGKNGKNSTEETNTSILSILLDGKESEVSAYEADDDPWDEEEEGDLVV